jgi:hypothetical protein
MMKKIVLLMLSTLALLVCQADVTNTDPNNHPCGSYLSGYNNSNVFDTTICGGDSINVLIYGGSPNVTQMTFNNNSPFIASSSMLLANNTQQPNLNIAFLAPYLNSTVTFNFSVTILDTSCTDSTGAYLPITSNYSITIWANTQLNLYFSTNVCENMGPQLLTQGVPSGGSYSGTGVTYSGGNYYFDPAVAGLGAHTITYSTSSGTDCDSVAVDSILVKPVPEIEVIDTTYCSNDLHATVSLGSPSSGWVNSYSWTDLSNGNSYGGSSALLSSGQYVVDINLSNGCALSDTFEVVELPAPFAAIQYTNPCFPSTFYQAITSPNYTYLWNTGDTSFSIYADSTAIYELWVTDTSNGCKSYAEATLCEGVGCPSIVPVACPGDSVLLCFMPCDSLAQLQYYWPHNGDSSQCTQVDSSGIYTQYLIDTNGNVILTQHEVYYVDLIAEISGDTVLCLGEVLELSANTDNPDYTSYQWTNSTNGILYANDTSIFIPANILGVGTHYFYLKVSNSLCYAYDTIKIEILPTLSGVTGPSNICYGDSLYLYPSVMDSSFSYSWSWYDASTGMSYSSNTDTLAIIPNSSANYNLTVSNGVCSNTYYHWTDLYNSFGFGFNGDPLFCANDSTEIGVALPPSAYDFLWATGDTTPQIMIDSAGTYAVTATFTSLGCSVTDSITITSIPAPASQFISYPDSLCANVWGMATTVGLPGYTYSWTGGVPGTSLNITSGGTYSLLITDPLTNCTNYQEFVVDELTVFDFDIFLEGVDPFCEGDEAALFVQDSLGNPPANNFDIAWSTGDSNDWIIVNTAGTYSVIVTDTSTGCADTNYYSISSVPNPSVSINVFGSGSCKDSILLVATPSSPYLNYLWGWYGASGLGDSLWLVANSTGSTDVFLAVTDSNGCMGGDTTTVEIPDGCCVAPNTDIKMNNGGTAADLIALNGGSPLIQNKTLVIKGLLDLGTTLITFQNCEVYMAPYSEIWAQSINLYDSHFRSCVDTLWKGIDVKRIIQMHNTIIEDAEIAIEMLPMPIVYSNEMKIRDSEFYNNHIGIKTSPGTSPVSYVKGTLITNTAPLKHPYTGEGSFIGILMPEPDYLRIGDGSDPSYQNTISFMEYGIVCFMGSSTIVNCQIHDIYDQSNAAIIPTPAAILAFGNNLSQGSISIGDSTAWKGNHFYNYEYGVEVLNMSARIIGNNFSGIGLSMGNPPPAEKAIRGSFLNGRDVIVHSNAFQNNNYGLQLLDMSDCYINIRNNSFSNGYQAIEVSNPAPLVFNSLWVQRNCIDDYLHGIRTFQMSSPHILSNSLQHNDMASGIVSIRCPRTDIQNNLLMANAYNLNFSRGIQVENANSFNRISCNSLDGFKKAFYFVGTSISRFAHNDMQNSRYGVYLDWGGNIGPQGSSGYPNDNRWIGMGFNIPMNSGGDLHTATDNSTNGSLSPFITRTGVWFELMNNEFYLGSTPVITNTTAAAPYSSSCLYQSCQLPPPLLQAQPQLAVQANALSTALDSANNWSYTPEEYFLERQVYEMSRTDSSLATELSLFVDSAESTNLEERYAVEEEVAQEDYLAAKSRNQQMISENAIEQTDKEFYSLYLQHKLDSALLHELDSQELAELESMAWECPRTHGPAVYAARAILRFLSAESLDFTHPCEISLETAARKGNTQLQADDIFLYPNPAEDLLYIRSEQAIDRMTVYNSLGEKVGEWQLSPHKGVDISLLQAGPYTARLYQGKELLSTEKLQIIR